MFSIVIPTCNRNDLLSKCLDMVNDGLLLLDKEVEIIVSDDGKDDNAKNLIEKNYPFARWVEGPKRGPAANRNNGVKNSKGEWLVFVDDDNVLKADYLEGAGKIARQWFCLGVWGGKVQAEF